MATAGLTELPERTHTVIVGAGLAGLTAARELRAAGRSVVVLEASDGIGGRVRTDVVDGYRLDRGFQVLLAAYPEVERSVDLDRLDMRWFDPGAEIWLDGVGHRIADPLRDRSVSTLLEAVRSPLLPTADKLRLTRLRATIGAGPARRLLQRPEQTTAARIDDLGFSEDAQRRFIRPLFAGIQLDPDLTTSSRMFDIIFRCLASGGSGVPSLGMGQLPAQLAEPIEDVIHLNARVTRIDAGRVEVAGSVIHADHVVVATDGPAASRLTGCEPPGSRGVSCLWFAVDIPPTNQRAIMLDGSSSGPVLNLAVMTNVAPSYAPAGRHLVACACPGDTSADLVAAATTQLHGWFGGQVHDWNLLRVDRIEHAQPDQSPPLRPRQRTRLDTGLWVCGDHRDTGSIQGAMFSGRRTADAILGRPRTRAEAG